MGDVFLSYAREDRRRAELLASAIGNDGWSVWWDPKIPPGKRFVEVIHGELQRARCAIVLWSTHSVASDFVQDEAQRALERGVLLPVLIDDVSPPLGFGRIQAADLRSWNGDPSDARLKELLDALRSALGRASPSFAEPALRPEPAPSITAIASGGRPIRTPVTTTRSTPRIRKPILTVATPILLVFAALLCGVIVQGAFGDGGALVMVLGVAAAITVPFVSIARMLNELATVTNSKPVDWWLLLVPFYSMHVMATVIPEEVRKAKASLHVARPPRSKLTYRTLWQYALAADLNDIAAALSVRNA